MIFKVSYLLKKFPIFVSSVHNFGKSDDDIIQYKSTYFQQMHQWFVCMYIFHELMHEQPIKQYNIFIQKQYNTFIQGLCKKILTQTWSSLGDREAQLREPITKSTTGYNYPSHCHNFCVNCLKLVNCSHSTILGTKNSAQLVTVFRISASKRFPD